MSRTNRNLLCACRPQMVRDNILNLNGPWQWDIGPDDKDDAVPPFNATLSGTILARSWLPGLLIFCNGLCCNSCGS